MTSIRSRLTTSRPENEQEQVEFLDESEQEKIVESLYLQNERVEYWSRLIIGLGAFVASVLFLGRLIYFVIDTNSSMSSSSLQYLSDIAAFGSNLLVTLYIFFLIARRQNPLHKYIKLKQLTILALIIGIVSFIAHFDVFSSFNSSDTSTWLGKIQFLRKAWLPLTSLIIASLWTYTEHDSKATRTELAALQRARYKYKRI